MIFRRGIIARRLGMAMALPLVLGSSLVVTAAPAQAVYVPSAATTAVFEARVIYLLNVQRVRYGRANLVAGWCPDAYAEARSAYMARTGYFYHQSILNILNGCKATVAAENLARGNVSADRFVALWMASPGHRANILDGRLTRIGVGAVYARGQWTVVTDFTRSS